MKRVNNTTTQKTATLTFFFLLMHAIEAQTVWGIDNSRTDTRQNAGLAGAAGAVSGFFETIDPVNYPAGATSWWHLLDIRHSNPANNYAMQFAGSFFNQELWFRKTNDNASAPWRKIVMEGDGKVGIGTDSPGGKLEVADGTPGDPTKYGTVQIVRSATAADNNFHLSFIKMGVSVSGIGYVPGTNSLGVWAANATNAAPSIVFTPQQTVGIGTNNTGNFKLAVNGPIGARKITVTQVDPFPDYVFHPDYQLPTLKEVEDFIRQNNRLPEMPAAAEVEKDGLDLGSNQVLLVKKVEELTLYVIEGNKKQEEQNKIILQLLDENAKIQLALAELDKLIKK